MSILIFLGVLFVLVLVHELGHFAVAKWTGMRVDEFGIGFPPKLFGIKRGETEYTFNLFPIGGFVKIYGEDSIVDGGVADTTGRAFTSKNKWAQSAVLLAGVTMNVLFAWVLISIAFAVGIETGVSEQDASPTARLTITNVLPGSPADLASIEPGSVVQSVTAGSETLTKLAPSTFSEFVAKHGSESITLAYTYGGELRVAQIQPSTGVLHDQGGKPAIGVALSQVDTVKRSVFQAIGDGFVFTVTATKDIAVGIVTLAGDALFMEADFSQVAGPVGIVGLVGEASAYGITALLRFTAFISLNLAVINVLPFPALDGGRLLFVLIEAIKGSPITPRYVATLNMIGFFLLILLMVAVTWNDIARLI